MTLSCNVRLIYTQITACRNMLWYKTKTPNCKHRVHSQTRENTYTSGSLSSPSKVRAKQLSSNLSIVPCFLKRKIKKRGRGDGWHFSTLAVKMCNWQLHWAMIFNSKRDKYKTYVNINGEWFTSLTCFLPLWRRKNKQVKPSNSSTIYSVKLAINDI